MTLSIVFAFLSSNFYHNMASQRGAGADHDVFCVFFGFDSPIDQNRGGIGTETTGLKHNPCMHCGPFMNMEKIQEQQKQLTKSTNPAQNQYAAGNYHEISQTKPNQNQNY